MPDTGYTVASASQLCGRESSLHSSDSEKSPSTVPREVADQVRRGAAKKRPAGIHGLVLEVVKDQNPTKEDIYFSPVGVTSSSMTLSDPIGSSLLEQAREGQETIAQARPDSEVLPQDHAKPKLTKEPKMSISLQQLDQMVRALASAALVSSTVHHHGSAAYASGMHDRNATAGKKLFRLQNRQFIDTKSQKINPSIPAICGPVDGVTLISANGEIDGLRGAHLRSHSDPPAAATRANKLLLPLEKKCFSTLHIHKQDVSAGGSRIVLHTVTAMAARSSKQRFCYISTEKDVTNRFEKAVLAEVARLMEIQVDDIAIGPSTRNTVISFQTTDWLKMADELQHECETAALIDSMSQKLGSINAQDCSMQTLSLLSELSRMKTSNRYILIARLESVPGESEPRVQVPLISEALSGLINEITGSIDKGQDLESASEPLAREICELVYDKLPAGRPFELAKADGLEFVVKGTPLYGEKDRTPRVWVLYVGRDAAVSLMRSAKI